MALWKRPGAMSSLVILSYDSDYNGGPFARILRRFQRLDFTKHPKSGAVTKDTHTAAFG
jgi:hypothetical protein